MLLHICRQVTTPILMQNNKMNEQRTKAKKLGIRKQRDVIAHFGVSTRRAKRHTKGRSEDLFKLIRSIPKWDNIHAVLDTSCYEMFLISTRTTALQRSRRHTSKINVKQRAYQRRKYWLVVCYCEDSACWCRRYRTSLYGNSVCATLRYTSVFWQVSLCFWFCVLCLRVCMM